MAAKKWDEINFIINNYNENIKQANLFWAMSALIASFTILSIMSNASIGKVIEGLKYQDYIMSFLILLAATNSIYCVSHANLYHIILMLKSYIDNSIEESNEEIEGNNRWK